LYYWRNEANYWQTRSIARPLCRSSSVSELSLLSSWEDSRCRLTGLADFDRLLHLSLLRVSELSLTWLYEWSLGFRVRRLLDRGRHSTRTNLSFLCSTFGILQLSRMGAIGSVAFRSVGTRIADCHRNGRWILRSNSGLGFSVCIWSMCLNVKGHWQMYLFSHLTYFIRLTLSDSRCGILTLTDPQGLPQGRSSLGVMSGGGGGNVYRGLSSATLSGWHFAYKIYILNKNIRGLSYINGILLWNLLSLTVID